MARQKINENTTVETADPQTTAQRNEDERARKAAAEARAAHIAGLETEKAYLCRQPEPDADRIKQVDDQLAAYADKPARRGRRETAGGAE